MNARPIRSIAVVVAALVLLVVAAPAATGAPGDGGAPPSEDTYIVAFKASVASVDNKTDRHERDGRFRSRFRFRHALKGFTAKLTPSQVRRLQSDPEVASVTPDRPVKALGAVPLAPGEPTPPTGVRRVEAASTTTARQASSVNVAVIDTGVDLAHPDLTAVSGTNCVAPGLAAQDDNGHGTHVAGSVAARNNGAGVVGVAPGTTVYAVKVLDSQGNGTQSQVICGIDWVTANASALNIKVANVSLGGSGSALDSCPSTADPEHKAICNSTAAGITYVVAAGNSGWDFDYAPVPDVPAAYPEVLTVSAVSDSDGLSGGTGGAPACRTTESDDRYASFSNYAATSGGQAHTIAGPGTCILSTWTGGTYRTISGTSMASPHLAGSVALCLGEGGAQGPCAGLTPAQIVQKMRSDAQAHTSAVPGYGFSGDPTRPVAGRYYGYLDWAGVPGSSPPPPPPVTNVTASPSATSIEAGTYRSGSAASLTNADTSYFQVNSTTWGTRTSRWYGSFGAVPSTLSNLKVAYQGKNSRSCTQTISVFRWADNTWVQLSSRTVGSSEVRVADLVPPGSAGSYVSPAGELRVRVGCTTIRNFYAMGNQLLISYDRP